MSLLPFSRLQSESADLTSQFEDGLQTVNKSILGRLLNLQSLIIMNPFVVPQLQHRVGGKLAPLPFFTKSLKRIFIPVEVGDHDSSRFSSARDIVWILVFCPTLRQAAFGLSISSLEDFNFSSELKSI